jgi:hypothetical protein
MLYRTNEDISDDLTCVMDSQDAGCSLSSPCSSTRYSVLWTYFLKVQLGSADSLYTTVNFGSFAIENTDEGTCDLYIQLLDSSNDREGHAIFGSLWLQNFVTLFSNDYSDGANPVQTV